MKGARKQLLQNREEHKKRQEVHRKKKSSGFSPALPMRN
jgi:hypothetical protein